MTRTPGWRTRAFSWRWVIHQVSAIIGYLRWWPRRTGGRRGAGTRRRATAGRRSPRRPARRPGPARRARRHRRRAVVGAGAEPAPVDRDVADARAPIAIVARAVVPVGAVRSSTCTASPRSSPLSASGVPVDDDRALVHDGQPVGEPVGLLQVVRGEQDRQPPRVASRPISCHSAARACGSRPVVGSSRNSTARPVHQPERDVEPALHAAGVRADRPPGDLGQARTGRAARRRARRSAGPPSPYSRPCSIRLSARWRAGRRPSAGRRRR